MEGGDGQCIDHYLLLGVNHDVSTQDLRSAFKRCALAAHPDKGGTKDAFQRVMLAFETLSDPVRRQRYDRKATSEKSACKRRRNEAAETPAAAARTQKKKKEQEEQKERK
eukprot:gb/GFBE01021309.1/.p1 GENE.gb/GFBE01021309.1/~~gb/GFBE01021309.1/.p1  ORF type:complete len:110 (+),score=27.36 gb/GFBE01021309.1/:1-330(+)